MTPNQKRSQRQRENKEGSTSANSKPKLNNAQEETGSESENARPGIPPSTVHRVILGHSIADHVLCISALCFVSGVQFPVENLKVDRSRCRKLDHLRGGESVKYELITRRTLVRIRGRNVVDLKGEVRGREKIGRKGMTYDMLSQPSTRFRAWIPSNMTPRRMPNLNMLVVHISESLRSAMESK
jgi:hypothetical protein